MRWVLLGTDVLLAVLRAVLLLFGYRVLGKPPGTDEKYDAAMAQQAPTWKAAGWCMVCMAVLGVIGYLIESLW